MLLLLVSLEWEIRRHVSGADGPAIMFVKGDRAVMLEFHNMNTGDPSVLTLAREAASRVR